MFHNLCVRITTGALLLVSSAVLLGCSSSERQASPTADSTTTTPARQNAPPDAGSGAPAMTAFVDPVTGALRDPTDAELAAMERDSKLQAQQDPVAREQKLKKRGRAVTVEGNETPLQGCAKEDGSVVVDHNCAGAKQNQ